MRGLNLSSLTALLICFILNTELRGGINKTKFFILRCVITWAGSWVPSPKPIGFDARTEDLISLSYLILLNYYTWYKRKDLLFYYYYKWYKKRDIFNFNDTMWGALYIYLMIPREELYIFYFNDDTWWARFLMMTRDLWAKEKVFIWCIHLIYRAQERVLTFMSSCDIKEIQRYSMKYFYYKW